MTKVAELHSGDSFGELALLTNSKRNASIRAKEECHFAVRPNENV
jgi:CRP-like cAMP-binding protein